MKKPKVRELKEAVKGIFSKPYTTEFPYKPHTPSARYRGRPMYNKDVCVGCGACSQVCPAKAIDMFDSFEDGVPVRHLSQHPARCIFCGECERNCITKEGIKLTQQFDIAFFDEKDTVDEVQHNLVVCRSCGEVIGTEKHLRWVSKRIGNLSFAQPLLLTQLMEELQIKTEYEEKVVPPIQRTDMLKVVCPKCRRVALISDEKKGK
ncbi:MAG: 4Fe-4S dicluster domain-containing protein [Candidatus Ratteibacteria bacterium]|nr:4Fe-4S dicluster domain-containing protein [Candidatus Ratteibacteria bacterium]